MKPGRLDSVQFGSPGAVKGVLIMLDGWLAACLSREGHCNDIDSNALVFEPVATNVGYG